MEATITNTTTGRLFIPGPNLDLAPTGDADGKDVQVWSGITVADLDGNATLKGYVVDGSVTVSVEADSSDAALATQGGLNHSALPIYAYADLPTGYDGRMAFVSDGRKGAEGAGAGTGLPCYYDADGADWYTFSGDIAVTI